MAESTVSEVTEGSRFIVADLVFVAIAFIVVWIRYGVLAAGGAPPTIDGGNWIAYSHEIFGGGVRSSTIVYPPLVPIVTKGAVTVFGISAGISGLAAIASTAPAVGAYTTLRRLGAGLDGLAPAILVLGASSVGEATAWGGFPQLIGLGLFPIALLQIDRMLRTATTRSAITAGVSFAAVLATSHFIAAITVIASLVLALLVLLPTGGVQRQRIRPRTVAWFLVPSLWLIPVYITLLGAFTSGTRGATAFNEVTFSTLFDQIEFLYRDVPWLWRGLLVLALLAPVVHFRHSATPVWRFTTSTITAVVVAMALTQESRFLYVLTPFAGLSLGLWSIHFAELGRRVSSRLGPARLGRLKTASIVALLVAGTWQISAGSTFFESQRTTYGVLTPELVRGIELVANATAADDTLAITSLNDAPLGWWVEAIAHRETFYGAPVKWLLFEDEIRRATLANDLFIPPFPDETRIRTAADQGIDLILVPTRWVFYDEDRIDGFTESYPTAVEYVTPELVVIDPAKLP